VTPPLAHLAALRLAALCLTVAAPAAEGPTPARGPASGDAAAPAPVDLSAQTTFEVDATPPFPSSELQLSDALRFAVDHNLDLANNAEDIAISEATVLTAVGAFDVFVTAGLNGAISESPQRGSQFQFAQGSRSIGGSLGFFRSLETGGRIQLDIGFTRGETDQPINIFDPNTGTTTLSSYSIVPRLTLTHPLLKGAGLRVNRADINRAKIARSQAEARRQLTAQNAVRDVVSAYWDVLFAQNDLLNKRQSVVLAQRQLDRTNALVAAGRLAPVEAKAVEQALAARESEVLLAENSLLDRSLTLRTVMGEDFTGEGAIGVVAVTDPVVQPRAIAIDEAVRRAIEADPQVRQLELALATKEIDEVVAANGRLPQLDFEGSFTPQGRSVDTAPSAATGEPTQKGSWGEAFRNVFSDDVGSEGLFADWTLSGSLTLTWDVQNRAPRGTHQRVLAELRQARNNLAQTRRTTSTAAIRAANGLRTTGKRMQVAAISLDLAEENLSAEQARFEVGRSTNFDVLQRLDERDKAAAEALSAQVEYLKGLVQLQALTGEILPAYGLDVR
jgi:outer membrane protein TolC